ncbi:hypoxanthine-guanine phosphoribosyltransferase [Oceanococcus atlanticus]|uniref:Hypoxanthine-guanine phosphoribosyltransferase n=1 Tax=Oceanococcus atlanticus TaxID=1317117 RepID=A0A1Y1SD65_9GAMM|nr:hypoxanthine-guanine phosphoribosyltransferase [Oceanococcus atlanticus]ORE86134.1 hypoxanthine-guanine phosphoribosyltransferase [Oceanococcus atlanticus]
MNDFLHQAENTLEHADILVDEGEVKACCDAMAQAIHDDLYDRDPVILCVMLGGMYVTSEITKRLRFPFELDYLQASRYRGETSGGELVWKVSPSVSLEDRHVLVVDDILDEGHTLTHILACLEQQRPASVSTAVLVEKQHDRRDPKQRATYVGVKLPDRYLIGCGMDYRNYYRQLPYIAALRAM